MEYKLEAKSREVKGEKIRKDDLIPAVLYGAKEDSVSLSFDYNTFVKLLGKAGFSNLIDLSIDDNEGGIILIHDVQYDPVTDRIAHVDLKRIEMGKEIEANIVINFINESPAVKEHGGTLIKNVDEVAVRCLPKDLVSNIEVNLNALATFDDNIKVKDLNMPEGMTIVSLGENDVIAKAIPALTEDQLKAMDEASGEIKDVVVEGEKVVEGEDGDKKEGYVKEEKTEEKKDN